MKVVARLFWGLIAVTIVAIASVPIALYFYGLQSVPEDRQPLMSRNIPTPVVGTYWRFLGGTGSATVSKHSPHGFWAERIYLLMTYDSRTQPNAEYQLLSEAARVIMFRQSPDSHPKNWHLRNASAFIWVSRHWSAEDAVSTVLLDGFFGHGFFGAEDASIGYFGKPLADLSETQLVHLFIILRAPSRLDLWCNLDRNREISGNHIARQGNQIRSTPLGVTPVPPEACGR